MKFSYPLGILATNLNQEGVKSNMKKLVLSIVIIVAFATYALGCRGNTTAQVTNTSKIAAYASTTSSSADDITTTSLPSSTTSVPPASSTTVATKAPATTARATATTAKATVTTKKPVVSTGRYVNGTYTGSPYSANYGTVQVRVVISGGKIASVSFLSHPSSNSESISINTRAMPVLIREAIAAQSSSVSTVSGATYTSGAFKKSLASALAKA